MPRQLTPRPQPRIRLDPSFEVDWPGASALATECILNCGAAFSAVSAKLAGWVQAAGFPSLAGFNVATILHGADEPLPPSEIARRMVLTPGTMTVLLDSLEKRGLVRRVRHPSDRRMALAELTAEGSDRVEQFRPRLHRAEKRLLEPLTRRRQQQLLDIVAVLQSAAEANIVP